MGIVRNCQAVGLTVAFMLTGLTACRAQPPATLIKTIEDAQLSERALQARVNEFTFRFTGAVEVTASRIYDASDDHEVRKRAIAWVIRANEECIRATSYGDALAELIDLWTLCAQIREFFETGVGRDLFGEYQPLVVDAHRRLESEAEAIAEEAVGELQTERGRQIVDQWVEDHPLVGQMNRTSTAPLLVEYLKVQGLGLVDVARTVDQSVNRISDRLDVLNAQLPKQVFWHILLIVEDLRAELGDLDVPALMSDLQRGLDLLDGLPSVIDEQRTATMEGVNVELTRTFDEIDRQRVEATNSIDSTVARTLEEIDRQRAAIDTTISDAFLEVDRQRGATLDRIEDLVAQAVTQVNAGMQETVDRAFWRGLQLAGIVVVACAVLILLFRARSSRALR